MKGIIDNADDLQKEINRKIFKVLAQPPKNIDGWVEAIGQLGLKMADLSNEIEMAKEIVN